MRSWSSLISDARDLLGHTRGQEYASPCVIIFREVRKQNIFYERKSINMALSASRANDFTHKLVKLFRQLDADNAILIGFRS